MNKKKKTLPDYVEERFFIIQDLCWIDLQREPESPYVFIKKVSYQSNFRTA